MPDFLPLPGQENIQKDISTIPREIPGAQEKARAALAPYFQGMQITPQESKISPSQGEEAAGGAGADNSKMLYESVHPNTFSRTLDFIRDLITGKWPIPRENGGDVSQPNQTYLTGEKGPELLKTDNQGRGTVAPLPGMRTRTPFMETGSGSPGALASGAGFMETGSGTPGGSSRLGSTIRKFATGGHYQPPAQTDAIDLVPGRGGTYELPGLETMAPAHTRAPTDTGTGVSPDWRDYGEGISYRLGPENLPGDRMARNRINAATRPGGYYDPNLGRVDESYFPRPPERSYYEAHPEQEAAGLAMLASERHPYEVEEEKFRESGLEDIAKDRSKTKEARAAAREELAEIQKGRVARGELPGRAYTDTLTKGMEYGPGSPSSQEKLAHAEYYRSMPGIREEIAEENRAARRRPFYAPGGEVAWTEEGGFQELPGRKGAGQEAAQKLFQNIMDTSWTTDELGHRMFDRKGFGQRVRENIRAGMLPKELGTAYPAPKPMAKAQWVTRAKELAKQAKREHPDSYYEDQYNEYVEGLQ
jgi:hypothetical protein